MDFDYWTREETERLLALRAEGMSFPKIAKLIGRSANACRNRTRRDPNAPPAPKWDDAATAELIALRKSGLTFSEIAKRLGCKVKACQDRYRRVTRTAPKKREKKQLKDAQVERKCLRCRGDFISTEEYRLCDPCREIANGYSHLSGVAW